MTATATSPTWASYIVTVGTEYAKYLEESGVALGGIRIMDLGDGRAVLDGEAVASLQRQPGDADGCIGSDLVMWLQGGRFDVIPAAPIVLCADVVTGRIEVQTQDWADGDLRWAYITDADGLAHDATDVEPWGADEDSMDRATEAVRDVLGFAVSAWERRHGLDGQVMYATVTGRA